MSSEHWTQAWDPFSGRKGGVAHGLVGVALYSWLAIEVDSGWMWLVVGNYALVVVLSGYRCYVHAYPVVPPFWLDVAHCHVMTTRRILAHEGRAGWPYRPTWRESISYVRLVRKIDAESR